MSWKGFKKAVARMPATLGKATGNFQETKDEEYEAYAAQLENLYSIAKKLSEESKKFKDSLYMMLTHQNTMANCFLEIFQSISDTNQSQDEIFHSNIAQVFSESMNSAKDTLSAELEQIERLVVAPSGDYIILLDHVKKMMTKRSHKLLDYDRHRSSVNKLKLKQSRTSAEEKSLGNYENLLDEATREYNNINNLLKQELPILLNLRLEFVDPCLLTFYNYQVKVFHTLYGIFYQAASDHFDLTTTAAAGYELMAAQVTALLTGLSVPKRFRANSDNPKISGPTKKPENVPKPPQMSKQDSSGGTSYVVALYDFDAQAPGDLSFRKDDKIEILERKDNVNDWWTGRIQGRVGQFPGNYVQEV